MLAGCEGGCFFFQTSIGNIHSHFEVIFSKDDETEQEGDEEEEIQKTDTRNGSVFEQYGIIPLICQVATFTNSSFDTVLSWSVCQTFYIASYIITKNRYDEQTIKQLQLRNKQK